MCLSLKRELDLSLKAGIMFVPQKGQLICPSKRTTYFSLKRTTYLSLEKDNLLVPQKEQPVCPSKRITCLSRQASQWATCIERDLHDLELDDQEGILDSALIERPNLPDWPTGPTFIFCSPLDISSYCSHSLLSLSRNTT